MKTNPISALITGITNKGLWDKELHLERNEYLKTKGSIDTNIYLVTSGSLRIFILEEHEENTIRFGYKNNLIDSLDSLDSFLSEKPSNLYIQALKKTTVKVINKKSYTAFI